MTSADGRIIGTTLVVNNGSPTQRWSLVFMGDGYQNAQLAQFSTDVQNFVNDLRRMRPFNVLWSAINVYRVDIESTDSGADDPVACAGTGASPRTFFDGSFCGDNQVQRLLVADQNTAITVANQEVPQWDMIMIVVNSSIYGGSGGGTAVFSSVANAGELALHEMGHTAFRLADEYEYYRGCGSGETTQNNYAGPEPINANVTIDTNRATIKWRSLINAATPVPTTRNSNCSQCDLQGSPVPRGTTGLFEGAYYHHCGAFRPEFDCKMRALGNEFCAVCDTTIRRILSPYSTWKINQHPRFQNHAPNKVNYELFVREGSQLRHHWFDYSSGQWNQGALFG